MSTPKFVLLSLLVCLFGNLVGGAIHDHHLGSARGTETGHNSAFDANPESQHPPLLMHCNVTGKLASCTLVPALHPRSEGYQKFLDSGPCVVGRTAGQAAGQSHHRRCAFAWHCLTPSYDTCMLVKHLTTCFLCE